MPIEAGGGWEVYLRRDAVTGRPVLVRRRAHNAAHSAVVLRERQCVEEGMLGRRFRGEGSAADAAAVRRAFGEVAHACAQRSATARPHGDGGPR
jgi:hypothetical protein